MNYLDLSLKELHEALVAKKVTPLELTKEALKRAHEDKCLREDIGQRGYRRSEHAH